MPIALRPPADQEARDRVVRETNRSCVVEAGAGTGKTSLLVARALELLASRRATLDDIAVITFTDKAAGELRVRLRQGIERRLRKTPEDRAIFHPALESIDRAAIATIHAFAASLLRDRPVEAGLDPRFTVFDELEARIILDEAFDRFWTESLTAGSPDLGPALRLGVQPRRIRDLAVLAAENRDLAPPPEPPALEAPEKTVRRFSDRALRLEEMAGRCRVSEDEGFRQIERLRRLRLGLDGLSSEDARLRILLEGHVRTTAGNKKNWDPGSTVTLVKQTFGEMEKDRLDLVAMVGGRVAWHLGAWLDGFRKAYAAALQARGGLDFQGLLIRARDLLRDRPDVRADFQRRYHHLLVDEFQDTDPLQAEIVFFLAEDAPRAADWLQASPAPGRLFIVGDPKQSIYRFRRADIVVYEAARRMVAASRSGTEERIDVNFRTVPGIIDWVNHVFGVLIKQEEGGHQPSYAPIAAHREPLHGKAGVALLPLPAGAEAQAATADGARTAEAALVASLIRRIMGVERWIVHPKDGEPCPVRYRDVTLLFRGLTGVGSFEDALAARDIPYRVVGGRAFFARQETRHLQAILRAIENPHDALSVAAGLRSPLLGCSDEDLLLYVAGAAGARFDYLRDADRLPPGSPVGDAFRLLRDLHLRRNDRPASATIEELLDRTGILALLLLRPQGEQRIANLLKVAELARRHEAVREGSFRSFISFLSSMEDEDRQEAESPTVEEDDDVVRLMTVHRAKGLEFPIVILADAGGQAGRSSGFCTDRANGLFQFSLSLEDGKASSGSWGYETAKETEQRLEREELARLLYVAATRARDHLILPVVPHHGRFQSFLGLLREAGALPGHASSGPPAGGPLAHCRVLDPSTLEVRSKDMRPFRIEDPLLRDQVDPAHDLLAERAEWKDGLQRAVREAARGRPVCTASGLEGRIFETIIPLSAGELPVSVVEEAEPFGPKEEAASWTLAPGRRRAIGETVHAVLEMVPPIGSRSADARLDAAVAAACLDQELSSAEEQDVRRLVKAAFRTTLARRLQEAHRIETEYPFAVTIGRGEGEAVLLEGRIDLLFAEGDGWVVADYKTDAVPDGTALDDFLVKKVALYRPQAAAYAAALEALGVRPKSILLVFLTAEREVELPVERELLELGRRAALTPSVPPR